MKRKKLKPEDNLNLVPMIDVTSFILLALGILVMSMKKEASLDNVLKLPMIAHAAKQDTAQLQIYVLPAVLNSNGTIKSDSTGLVAFMGKAAVPAACPYCKAPFRAGRNEYLPGSLLDMSGQPLASVGSAGKQDETEVAKVSSERPPTYMCAKCKGEISPYVKLSEIPLLLRDAKKKVIDEYIAGDKQTWLKQNGTEMPAEKVKALEDSLKHNMRYPQVCIHH
jgi:hypothetical protein